MAAASGKRTSRSVWLFGGLGLVVLAVLAWGALVAGQPEPEAQPQRQPGKTSSPESSQSAELAEQLMALQRREPGDPLAMGRVDAPVVLIKYEDFRCPFCSKFATDVEPKLIERYVETGVLRIEWRDFPVFGKESLEMAKAGRAAARQGKFWEFHDVAYAMGSQNKKTSFPEERIQQVARKAGVPDLAQFNTDRKDPAILRAIEADVTEARQLGLSGTPSFLVNTQPVLGAQPLEQFAAVIEAEKAKVS